MKDINNKTSHLSSRGIIAYADVKKPINEAQQEVKKESQCAREAGGTVQGIRKEIKWPTIAISLEHSNAKCRDNQAFQQKLEPRLMKECNEQSKIL